MCSGLAAKYRMPMELAITLAALALYDIVIFCDDSGMPCGLSQALHRCEECKADQTSCCCVGVCTNLSGRELRHATCCSSGMTTSD